MTTENRNDNVQEVEILPMPSMTRLPIYTKGYPWWRQLWIMLRQPMYFRVDHNWFFTMPDGQVVMIPQGFIFDGASTPRFLWGVLSPLGILLIPGLIHDFGYRYDYLWAFDKNRKLYKLHLGGGKKFWDDMFLKVADDLTGMIVTGWLSYWALRLFGSKAWTENRKKAEQDIVISY